MSEQRVRKDERRDRRTEGDGSCKSDQDEHRVHRHVRAFIVRNLVSSASPPRRALPLRTTSCTSALRRVVLDHLLPTTD